MRLRDAFTMRRENERENHRMDFRSAVFSGDRVSALTLLVEYANTAAT